MVYNINGLLSVKQQSAERLSRAFREGGSMKRLIAVIIALISAFSLIPAAGAAGFLRAPVDYSVSGGYAQSVYYRNLKEVQLTGNQRLDLINIALSQVGYHEGNSLSQLDGSNSSGSMNYSEYGYYFGMEVLGRGTGFFYEWCAMFTAWSARMAKLDKSIINNATYAHVGSNPYYFHMSFHPRGTYTPLPGDLIFYDWAYSQKNWDHVGIVLYAENGRVHAVEGNASDKVIMRDISLYDSEIQGFGSPAYTSAMASAVNVSSYAVPEEAVKQGDSGDGVKWLQAALLHLGYPCPIDGHFGQNTLRQLKRFQQNSGVSPTGTCGSQTKTKIKKLLSAGPVTGSDPTSYPFPQRTLREGCTGSDVKWLQAALKKLGEQIVVDGDFGPATKEKVIAFQSRHGLKRDGLVGPATRERIKSALGGGGTQASSDPSSYPVPARTLSFGCSGEDVKWLQAVLTQKGLTMNMTGYFGEKTRNYVKAVQRYYGMTPDGIVGPATLKKFKQLLEPGSGMGLAGSTGAPVNVSAYPEPSRNLKLGSSGDDVKWLQAALKKLGFSVTVDGIFGSATELKLKAFQRAAGILADGKCGPATRRELKSRI